MKIHRLKNKNKMKRKWPVDKDSSRKQWKVLDLDAVGF